MSTAPPPGTNPPPTALRSSSDAGPREIKLISRSPLFYWWPIWVLGYTLAIWTAQEGHRLAIVPASIKVVRTSPDTSDPAVYRVEVPAADVTGSLAAAAGRPQNEPAFKPRVSRHTWMGPVFSLVLVLTVLITNVPMRGLWSFVAIILVVVLCLLLSLLNVWDDILVAIGNLHIFINMAGYLFIATAVFILWFVSVVFFDPRTYMIVSPGQIRVCEHIGDSVRTYGTDGMTFEKQRDDLFRHIMLGFGSGDLIVRTSGAQQHEIKLPNVLGISWKLDAVQKLIAEKQVTIARGG